MASSSSISWRLYDDEYNLSEILTEAARACVNARATHPGEFLCSYFNRMVNGDSPDVLECAAAMAPSGEMGLRVFLKLFTNTEAEAATLRIPIPSSEKAIADGGEEKTSSNAAPPSQMTLTVQGVTETTLLQHLREAVLPRLQQVGVYQQSRWDEIIDTAKDQPTDGSPLPRAVCHVLSVVACIAAAKNLSQPLFKYHRMLYTDVVGCGVGMANDTFSLPQLLIPFFGYNTATATPSCHPGSVCLHTLYLMPGASVTEGTDTSGIFTRETAVALMNAICTFGEANAGAVVREDGAYVVENCENISDAVQIATDALANVGLRAGTDVCFGIRIACPVVRHNTAAVAAPAPKSKKSAPKAEATMYRLFAGDADVTAAQLAEYVRQEVEQCKDRIVFVEDTHDAQDEQGLYTMQNFMKEWKGIVSGSGMYMGDSEEEHVSRVVLGTRRMWSENVTVMPSRVGSITGLLHLCKQAGDAGRSYCIACESTASPTRAAIDLAFGHKARFLNTGGLRRESGCDALSYYVTVVESVTAMRAVREQVPADMYKTAGLPPYEGAIPVPEFKRKIDRKRKKGR